MKTLTGNKALEKLIKLAFTKNPSNICKVCGKDGFTYTHVYRTTENGHKLLKFTATCDNCSSQTGYEFEDKKEYN